MEPEIRSGVRNLDSAFKFSPGVSWNFRAAGYRASLEVKG